MQDEEKKTITTSIIFPKEMYEQMRSHCDAMGIPIASWVKTVIHEKLQSLGK